jgi:hypothetical protein
MNDSTHPAGGRSCLSTYGSSVSSNKGVHYKRKLNRRYQSKQRGNKIKLGDFETQIRDSEPESDSVSSDHIFGSEGLFNHEWTRIEANKGILFAFIGVYSWFIMVFSLGRSLPDLTQSAQFQAYPFG